MAKRFGRNQRRKMRQEIEGLRLSQDFSARHAREMQKQYYDLQHRLHMWADEIEHVLRDDSVFNERIAERCMDTDLDMVRLSNVGRVSPSFDPKSAMNDEVAGVIEAFIWRINIEPDAFNHMVRVELHNRYNQTVAYALSADHVWHQRDVEPVARMIAEKLVGAKVQR